MSELPRPTPESIRMGPVGCSARCAKTGKVGHAHGRWRAGVTSVRWSRMDVDHRGLTDAILSNTNSSNDRLDLPLGPRRFEDGGGERVELALEHVEVEGEAEHDEAVDALLPVALDGAVVDAAAGTGTP